MPIDLSLYNGFWGDKVLNCDNYHYDYQIKIDEWTKIELALKGGDAWINAVVEKYECESDGKLKLRKDNAWDRISVVPPLQAFQNMARGSADQARVEGASERIEQILDEDFDNNGNNWFSWVVENVGLNTPAYGKYHLFASSPANIAPLTLQDEKDFHPFCFGRTPLQVLNWRYENGNTRDNGQYADILILTSEIVSNQETMFNDRVTVAVRFTREAIFVMAVDQCRAHKFDGTVGDFSRGDLIRAVENPIGLVPCRTVDIGESVIRGIINASAQSMNIQSSMYAGVFDGNFNQKVSINAKLPEGDSLDLGTSTVLDLPENADFKIVEAPSGEVEVAKMFFDDTQNGVDVILQQQYANLAKQGGNAPSGEALTQMNSDRVQAVKVVMDLAGDALEDIIAWMHLLAGETVPTEKEVEDPETGEKRMAPSDLKVIMPVLV